MLTFINRYFQNKMSNYLFYLNKVTLKALTLTMNDEIEEFPILSLCFLFRGEISN